MEMMIVLYSLLLLITNVEGFCYTGDGINDTCELVGISDYCEIEIHINDTTKQPLYIRRDCFHNHGGFPTSCLPFIHEESDLLEACCSTPGCNRCPSQNLVDKVDLSYRDALYDLFPEECRQSVKSSSSSSAPVSSSSILLPSSSVIVSVISTPSSSIVPPTTPTTVTSPPTAPPALNIAQVSAIITVVGVLVLFIFICIICIIGIITCYMVKGRQRRIVRANDAPPYCGNAAFDDLTETVGLSCSSNALTESRLLQSRTIAHDVTLSKLIGKGRFGQVYFGKTGHHQVIAVKIYENRHVIQWEREISIYQTDLMNNPYILKYIFSDKKETAMDGFTIQLWTALEYHQNGNLQEFLKKGTTKSQAFILATSFLSGLHFLHKPVISGRQSKPGIAHRDIKTPNIMVKTDGACCIGDLGLAVKQEGIGVDDIPYNKLSGTKRYLAPEILNQSMNFEKFQSYVNADIYAASLVIWEIFNSYISTYSPPFYEYVSNAPELDDMRKIVVEENLRPSLKRFVNEEELVFLSKLLEESWAKQPLARPSALNILKKLENKLSE